ncbi:MAG: NAD(P)/FAD-dependent oxidoreductase [Actinobacteria bacterium]|nr:NAD(P)/FAD-dependent oxidoreductase [Actinomycetota bacterium]
MSGSVIVIGAGLAGLSAGVYSRLNGYDSLIVEHHSQPGGVAAWWTRKDYLFDGGIHFLMGHRPGQPTYELYEELGIFPGVRVVDMHAYAEYVDEASGRSVVVGSDIERLADDLTGSLGAGVSPAASGRSRAGVHGDRAVVARLVEEARSLRGVGFAAAGMERPPELSRFYHTARDLWDMRGLLRHMHGSMGRPVAEFAAGIEDPWVRWVVRNLFMPDVPVWFVTMLLAMLADGQLGLLKDGCRSFVGAIERRYLDLGGEVVYGATGEEILVEHDRAVGVRLTDGTEHRADAVISAADGRSTIFDMLRGRYVNDGIVRRYRDWRLFEPYVMVSFGVRRTFPGEPPLSAYRLEHPLSVGDRTVEGIMMRRFDYGDVFAPSGRAVIQVEFESDFEHWARLRRDRAAYKAEKQRVSEAVLDRLERHYPGLGALVDVVDVATPYTTWRYTRNERGAFEGWMPVPEVMTRTLERTLPGLDGFFMAGQWVMPGGGVPPVLFSGRHAVQLMCSRDGRTFRRS